MKYYEQNPYSLAGQVYPGSWPEQVVFSDSICTKTEHVTRDELQDIKTPLRVVNEVIPGSWPEEKGFSSSVYSETFEFIYKEQPCKHIPHIKVYGICPGSWPDDDELPQVPNSKVDHAQLPDPGREVVIAVMGVTGAGKSSFIRSMTGCEDVFVGHGLSSATTEVESFKFTHRGINFVLVDTPGFDDSTRNDEIIVTRILDWLASSFRDGVRLTGLIYLHRIIDPRIRGTAYENLRMFRKLCGPDSMPNIILGTTFWNNIGAEKGANREKELCEKNEFWGEMVKKGSRVVRIGNDREAGLKLLHEIAQRDPFVLAAQREMMEEKKSAAEMAAAKAANKEIEQMKREMEAKAEAQREENARELTRREASRKEELRLEISRQREVARAKALAEAERLAREQREYWQAYYARQELARQEQEKEKAHLREEEARIERKRKAEVERMERLDREAKEARLRYIRSYTCVRQPLSSRYCDKCKVRLKGSYTYYHCCHCHNDNYDHCVGCGRDCGHPEHPLMSMLEESECLVM